MKSYSEISRTTGYSISHISRIFRGERRPSLKVLLILAKEIDMPVEDLIRKLGMRGVSKW
jgi:transcriptional regulator with XRE-family HTH domain